MISSTRQPPLVASSYQVNKEPQNTRFNLQELSSETSDTGANQLCHHEGNITMGGAGGPPIPSHRNPLVNGAWCNETLRNLSGTKNGSGDVQMS